jgi:hypothetical protein
MEGGTQIMPYGNLSVKALFSVTVPALLWLTGTSSATAQSRPLYTKPPTEHWKPVELMPLSGDGLPIDIRDRIFLDRVPPVSSVDDAQKWFDKRAAAAIRVTAGTPVDNVGYEDYGITILASFAYQDYFDDAATSSLYRSQAAESLKRQQAGKTGTNGDYDFLLQSYLTLIYRYYDDLTSIPCDMTSPCGSGNANLVDHIINDLLNVRGPLDQHESEYTHGCVIACVNIPETENHLLMIETARYLTNQLLYGRTHDLRYDNRRNGNSNDPQATAVWLLNALRGILTSDFSEYNARPYQDMIMLALLNLESYSYDGDVKLAARMALDYISAKIAVSSNDLRRAPPFRRRNEDQHYGPEVDGWLISPLLLPAGAYEPDPQGTWFLALAGNPWIAGRSVPKSGAGNFSMAMVFAGLHEYRVPEPIVDLFVNPSNRHFYQKLQHHNVTRDRDSTEVVDELYSGSPSYLITAGGHPTDYAYVAATPIGYFGISSDLGAAMPTTFIPTCYQQGCPDDLSLKKMIQFDHYTTEYFAVSSPGLVLRGHYHMCAATDFACGVSVYVPDWIQNAGPDDRTIVKQGPWIFIDRGHVGEARPGFYLAIYRTPQLAFLEAYDTWLHPGLTFDQFRSGVLAPTANGRTVFTTTGTNTYITQSGQRIEFQVNPATDSSQIVSLSSVPPFHGQFAAGDVINSEQGSGVIRIWNAGFGRPEIKLDMSDVNHPTRISEQGDRETAEDSDSSHHVVWVNFAPNVPHGSGGDFYQPFQKLADAQRAVLQPGVINILPGSTVERDLTLSGKRMTLRSFGTGAVIRGR